MIIRLWEGRTQTHQADEYLDYLKATGVHDCCAIGGSLGVQILRRFVGEQAEFVLLSMWNGMEAVRQFAGAEFDKARYYKDDTRYLVELEPQVRHYEVALEATPDGDAAKPALETGGTSDRVTRLTGVRLPQ
jgi:heme-degrading monooxygenase HmoA